MRGINPECRVIPRKTFFLPETRDQFDFSLYDYVVDAIDTVTGKLALIEAAQAAGTPIISSMGTGNKLDPTSLRVADIYETSICPLARVMRAACRKRGIPHLKVVYSVEPPLSPMEPPAEEDPEDSSGTRKAAGRRDIPGSTAFVPPAAGLLLAAEVVRDLIGISKQRSGRREGSPIPPFTD